MFNMPSNKVGLKPLYILFIFCVCRFIAAPLYAGKMLPDRPSDLSLNVAIYNKERTAILHEVRAGDSVVLRIAPQRISGVAFVKIIDSVFVELLSGFSLLAQVNPTQPITYPIGITGPVDRHALFTKVPDSHLETVQARAIWSDPLTGSLAPLSGNACVRVRPGPPERVVFRNPGSNTTTRINPGIAFACTLMVNDRFGNRADDSVKVYVRTLMPDISVIVGGTPNLTIRTDSSGVAAFLVQLTDEAKTNDVVRIEAEIEEDTLTNSAPLAKASINFRSEQGRETRIFSPAQTGKPMAGWVDLRGRRNTGVSSSVRIALFTCKPVRYFGKNTRICRP